MENKKAAFYSILSMFLIFAGFACKIMYDNRSAKIGAYYILDMDLPFQYAGKDTIFVLEQDKGFVKFRRKDNSKSITPILTFNRYTNICSDCK